MVARTTRVCRLATAPPRIKREPHMESAGLFTKHMGYKHM